MIEQERSNLASKRGASCPARSLTPRRSCKENEAIVVDALAHSKVPLSAYDIVAHARLNGRKLVPTQVYRTLARLIEQERVGRIESLSAFALKQRSKDICLIDSSFHSVQWISGPDLVDRLFRLAKISGFQPRLTVVEIHGEFGATTEEERASPQS